MKVHEPTGATKGGGGSDYSMAGGGVITAHRRDHPNVTASSRAAGPEIREDRIGDFDASYVSRLWAQDWDSAEDSFYDSW
jgi:hypothetical protein